MLTILVLLTIFLIIGITVAIIAGMLAISPLLLIVFSLPVIDILVLKVIFGKKKKD